MDLDKLAAVIEEAINSEPHCRRLYPELYALQVAEHVKIFLEAGED